MDTSITIRTAAHRRPNPLPPSWRRYRAADSNEEAEHQKLDKVSDRILQPTGEPIRDTTPSDAARSSLVALSAPLRPQMTS